MNLAVFVHFNDVYAFERHFFSVRADAVAGPLHRRAVAGNKDVVFGQADTLEIPADRLKEFADCIAAGDPGRADRIESGSILGELAKASASIARMARKYTRTALEILSGEICCSLVYLSPP